MPITKDELKRLATELCTSDDECTRRAGISRAYYFVFHTLMPFVEKLPESSPGKAAKAVSHQEMVDRLSQWQTVGLHPKLAAMKVVKGQIQRELDLARAMRVRADYQLKEGISLADAEMQVARMGLLNRAAMQVYNLLALQESSGKA